MKKMLLHNFNTENFLKNYWQKKPLLIRNAFKHWSNPISAEELAGLALDEDVESRIVNFQGDPDNDNKSNASSNIDQWVLKQGPFTERDFTAPDSSAWTLLVQAVDHYVPEVAKLREYFEFIPAWLIDDIMVSYATQHASVGPHFDRYDVFLIQGAGRREWRVGSDCHVDQLRANESGLSLIDTFPIRECYELEPGDALYLPPGIAHWGVALDNDCMTYSVGFRTPLENELISDFMSSLQDRATQQEDSPFIKLPYSTNENSFGGVDPHRIQPNQMDSLKSAVVKELSNENHFLHWFGCWASQPKYETQFERLYDDLLTKKKQTKSKTVISGDSSALQSEADTKYDNSAQQSSEDWQQVLTLIAVGDENKVIQKYAGSRFYYSLTEHDAMSFQLFINGREVSLGLTNEVLIQSAIALCQQTLLAPAQFNTWLLEEQPRQLLKLLFDSEQLYLVSEN